MSKKKELKQPDQLQLRLTQVFNWLTARSKLMLMSAAPIALIVVSYVGYQHLQKQKSAERREALAKIDHVYESELKKQAEAQSKLADQMNSLKKQETSAKSDSDKARIKKEIKDLSSTIEQLKPDHTESLKQHLAFYEANQENPEGFLAAMHGVHTYIEQKDIARATKLTAQILTAAKGIPFYDVQVRLMYSNLLVEQKEYNLAMAEMEKVEAFSKEDEAKAKILLTKAKILLYQEKKEDAQKLLTELIQKHESSQEAQKARSLRIIAQHKG